ncbi:MULTISPECIES: cyclophilin-like fold protein [unclassified Ruminococcus]|uniref:cyclophilin-like fold protein n=1 Tax=unclassified Ruminococcus TaxID=2608920 RepID=UPI00210CC47B|nr:MULTISPECIES: cyclophilin-like fold protein [unclassified Ruminococcus]MCQ4023238.1 hypothetical protein [Ruminococcus sp. zg-924]MCQ4115619.1 hypothetical protein [Ruminococcus sp. zg-921]
MKKSIIILLGLLFLLIMSACSSKQSAEQTDHQTSFSMSEDKTNSQAEQTKQTEISSQPDEEPPKQSKEEEPMEQAQFYITANGTTLTAKFADNGSADALRDLLREGDLTINMSDYGGFEKVGSIGTSLPCKDTHISTTTGDVVLYQGNQIVIFYGTNSWSYSRLGKVEGATAEALLSAFGSDDAVVTFSLISPR